MGTPKTIGRYEIVDELGQGAMGSVFRAHDPSMDRMVALKTILMGALLGSHGDEFRQRFYREARAAGALAHPGIVPVFDVGEHEGQPYLVMEYVNGRTLADAMKKGERVSMDRVCEIGQQLAEALGHAHRKGVVHRDIKPANILMTNAEAYGIERPQDYGLWRGQDDGGRDHDNRPDAGNASIHAARAVYGSADRRAHGSVFTGRDSLLDGDRGTTLSRRDHDHGLLQDCAH